MGLHQHFGAEAVQKLQLLKGFETIMIPFLPKAFYVFESLSKPSATYYKTLCNEKPSQAISRVSKDDMTRRHTPAHKLAK